ncbi:MAG TPA: YihY/virulence factor BrkB family protein, partial [Stellaceae bacterium]
MADEERAERKDDGLAHAREKTPATRTGRKADRPRDIPARGWKNILLRVKERISRDNISIIAAGVAFYAFMAIPSTLTALVTLYGLLFNPADVERQIASLQDVLPGDAINLIADQLKAVTSGPPATLGLSLVISVLVAIWGARSAMSTLITALNVTYGEEEKRGLIRFQLAAFGLTAAAIVFAVIALALIAVLPAVIGLLPFGEFGKTAAAVLRWPILVLLMMVGLAALYRYAPSRAEPKWRWVSWGAVAATLLWLAGSALFSIYVGKFASYNKTYGSLG